MTICIYFQCIPVPVKHVANSYGIVMVHEDGWKLTYSGDSMPCQGLVNHGGFLGLCVVLKSDRLEKF